MNELEIVTENGQMGFTPGGRARGTVKWSLEAPPESVVLRLVWFTRGAGTEDVGVAGSVDLTQRAERGERAFAVKLPAGPYSFSGKAFSITWALEAIAKPTGEVARVEIVMGPGGKGVEAGEAEEPSESKVTDWVIKRVFGAGDGALRREQ